MVNANLTYAHVTDPADEALTDARQAAKLQSHGPEDLSATDAALSSARVVCSVREGAVRISPHFYNSLQELEQAADVARAS